MSTTSETTTARRPRNAEHAAEPKTESLGNVTIEIAGLEVTLPVKFAPGHTLTENQAKVLDAAYQRQFTNNQNASAKSRAEAHGKATTDAERAAKAALTAAEIAALYTDYEPSVGGTPRQSTMEKLRQDAAWRAWVALVTEHNADMSKRIIAKAVQKGADGKDKLDASGNTIPVPVTLPSGKGAAEKREAMSAQLLTLPQYADRIQAQLDAIMAERGTAKPKADDTVVASGDLF